MLDHVEQQWTQDGKFKDADGVDVRCYDDVVLLKAAHSEPNTKGSIITLPAGTSGTVLFYTIGEPCWLQLEYETDEIVLGVVEAANTRLYLRNEEKYSQ